MQQSALAFHPPKQPGARVGRENAEIHTVKVGSGDESCHFGKYRDIITVKANHECGLYPYTVMVQLVHGLQIFGRFIYPFPTLGQSILRKALHAYQ